MFAFSSQKHILVLAPDPHKPFLMNLNSGGIILDGILIPSKNLKFGEFPPPKIALRPSTIGFFCGKNTGYWVISLSIDSKKMYKIKKSGIILGDGNRHKE